MEFNRILKDLRLESGYTQMQLAHKANLAVSCIAMLETNKREPTAQTLISLSDALNVSVDYLLGLEDDFGARTASTHLPLNSNEYSSEEQEIIEKYRSLPKQLKKLVQDQLNVFTDNEEITLKSTKKN
ncbi:MAG: helix-turn-helix transcriptional regulator [Clostridia bacterium]|nr:helix-turn-helix transcriptional regulator [Clostridia bacterium]